MDTPAPVAPRPSRRHLHCEVCARWVLPLRPHWGWRYGLIGAWALIPTMAFFAAKGPGLILLPLAVLCGMGLIGPLHGAAGEPPHCPDCGKAILPPRRRP